MLLPNVEGVVIARLRADHAVTELVGNKVVSSLPAGVKDWPYVRVTRFGGRPAVSTPLVLDEAELQVDVFATTKADAFDLVNAVRSALADMAGVHRLGTVTGSRVGVLQYAPDDTFDPPIPRYLLDVTVWAKPTATL